MSVLSNLEPGEVFHFFEKICNIPHGSGNVEQISNYLRDFAKERNLFCIQDEMKNIIIVKEATPGYEKEEPIIIQGHMDMVAVHKPELDIDMKKEPLKLKVDGDFIYAEGTSLGGDDGIAVAYALAFLDSATLAHPKLEVLFTVDEEIGMDGAMAVDLSMLTGHQLLNIDSEEEGILLTSCAGGSRADCELPVTRETVTGKAYSVKVCGLQGGHSGVEIHKERGNANCLMGRILYDILKVTGVNLVSMQGGMADNAITNETTAVLIPADAAAFESSVKETEQQIKAELATKDPDFRVEISEFSEENCQAVAVADVKRIASLICMLPNGVQATSKDVEGLVETSLNPGTMKLLEDKLVMGIAIRSSMESAKKVLQEKVSLIVEAMGGSCEISSDYPGWAYRVDSPFREKMAAVYERMYGKQPKIEAVHAGLECGILAAKIPNLDGISLGPDMQNVHTTEEKLSISSTKRMWEYLQGVLAEKSVTA